MPKHRERIRRMQALSAPPKHSPYWRLVEEAYEGASKEQLSVIQERCKLAYAIASAQSSNGAGFPADQCLRYFHAEYNERLWNHGSGSFPSTFNVLEAFFKYRTKHVFFELRKEEDYLCSFEDFLDWYTSSSAIEQASEALEFAEAGKIYSFSETSEQLDFELGTGSNRAFVIQSVSFVRHQDEVAILAVCGENYNKLPPEGRERLSAVDRPSRQTALGRGQIEPSEDFEPGPVFVDEEEKYVRAIVAMRVDYSDSTFSARYLCHDIGDSFTILTDDPELLLVADQVIPGLDEQEFLAGQQERLSHYHDLFNILAISPLLGVFVDEEFERTAVDRVRTDFADARKAASLRRVIKRTPPKYRKAVRDVVRVKTKPENSLVRESLFWPENFHIDEDGYWKKLEPGKFGAGKEGEPVEGKTWVNEKRTWMEAEPDADLVTKRRSQPLPDGPNPGYVYVMRSPTQERDIFKVGLTTRKAELRAKELSRPTGVPGKFHVVTRWPVGDCKAIENEAHTRLAYCRVDPRREFFQAPLEVIIQVVQAVIEDYPRAE